MLAGGVGPRGSTAAAQTAETASAALDVLRKSISVDVHTPWRQDRDHLEGAAQRRSRERHAGGIAGGRLPGGRAGRPHPRPGMRRAFSPRCARRSRAQLYKHHLERLAWVDEMVANHGLRRALSAADLEAAHRAGQPAIVGDVEGLDFLERKLERLEEAHQRGIRHLQLVHYTPNDIGDFQTGAITHQGLTPFGAEVIRACHRLGFVCDVAHATEDTVKQAVKVATKPLLLSHTALCGIAGDGADAAATGGRSAPIMRGRSPRPAARSASGTSFRASTNMSRASRRWPTSSASITSASAPTSRSRPGSVQDYTQWVHLVAAMLRGGFTPEEAGKIAGGNYMRIFRAAVG